MDLNTPIGRRQLALKSTGQNTQKVLSVPNEVKNEFKTVKNDYWDESKPIPDLNPNNISKMRKEMTEQQNKISNTSKDVLELLLGLRRRTDHLILDGIKFTLRSLKTSETRFILQQTAKASAEHPENYGSQALVLMDIKIRTLSLSLCAIDDKAIKTVLGTDDHEELVNILYEMDDDLIDKLYDKFSTLNKEFKEVADNSTSENITENLKK